MFSFFFLGFLRFSKHKKTPQVFCLRFFLLIFIIYIQLKCGNYVSKRHDVQLFMSMCWNNKLVNYASGQTTFEFSSQIIEEKQDWTVEAGLGLYTRNDDRRH